MKNPVVIRTKLFKIVYVHCSKSHCRTCPHGPYVYSSHGEYFGHPVSPNIAEAMQHALSLRQYRKKKINRATIQRLCTIAEKVAQSIAAGVAAGAAAHFTDLKL